MNYKKITPKIISDLKNITSSKKVLTLDEDIETYTHDEVPGLYFSPAVVIKPSNEEEIMEIMKVATKEKIPVTPRGAGTGLSGGALPVRGGICLSLEKFTRIKEIDKENLMIVTEPGVITGELGRTVEKEGLFYPPDPASLDSCTIGGNVAECAGGPRALKYGVTRNYVTGLRAVLPDGNILKLGGKIVKNVTGYPIMDLLIGSEGTLAVITEITLKLLSLPLFQIDLLIPFNTVNAAAHTITGIIRDKKVLPATIEFMDNRCIKACEKYLDKEIPFSNAAAHLLIQLDGKEESELERDMLSVGDIAVANGALEVLAAKDRPSREKMWKSRRSITDALKSISPIVEHEDIVVPRSEIPKLLDEIKKLEDNFSVHCACFGHAGDGNVHVHIMKEDMANEKWKEILPVFLKELFLLTIKLGGVISGEHGIGYTKRQYLPIALEPSHISLMKRIKTAFDPLNILNPEKIFPD